MFWFSSLSQDQRELVRQIDAMDRERSGIIDEYRQGALNATQYLTDAIVSATALLPPKPEGYFGGEIVVIDI